MFTITPRGKLFGGGGGGDPTKAWDVHQGPPPLQPWTRSRAPSLRRLLNST